MNSRYLKLGVAAVTAVVAIAVVYKAKEEMDKRKQVRRAAHKTLNQSGVKQ
jgi:hypothetical protein